MDNFLYCFFLFCCSRVMFYVYVKIKLNQNYFHVRNDFKSSVARKQLKCFNHSVEI